MLNNSKRSNPGTDVDLIKGFERLEIEKRWINPLEHEMILIYKIIPLDKRRTNHDSWLTLKQGSESKTMTGLERLLAYKRTPRNRTIHQNRDQWIVVELNYRRLTNAETCY